MISGFGYCPSTKEYKIISLHYVDPSKKSHVQVYTVGGGTEWRNKVSIHISKLDSPIGIYTNGALHWLDSNQLHEDYTMIACDLEDEEFHIIPLSGVKDVKHNHRPKLVRGNNLSLVYTIFDHKPYCTYIWSYKRKSTDGCGVKENYKDKNLWHWIKEFRIEWEEPYWKDLLHFETLATTKNNEVLFRCNDDISTLFSYDLNTSTLIERFLGRYIVARGSVVCLQQINKAM